eukprot:9045748-Karenia_brevis.AAC.1
MQLAQPCTNHITAQMPGSAPACPICVRAGPPTSCNQAGHDEAEGLSIPQLGHGLPTVTLLAHFELVGGQGGPADPSCDISHFVSMRNQKLSESLRHPVTLSSKLCQAVCLSIHLPVLLREMLPIAEARNPDLMLRCVCRHPSHVVRTVLINV